MSTKNFTGFRLAEGVDPFAFINIWRTALKPVRERADLTLTVEYAVIAHARGQVEGRDSTTSPLQDAAMRVLGWGDKKADRDDSSKDPHSFDVCLGRNPDNGRIYGIYFTDCIELAEAFRTLDQVEPYPYWNNTDAPDDVSDEQWDARGREWDRIWDGSDIPAESMMCSKLSAYEGSNTLMSGFENLRDDITTILTDRTTHIRMIFSLAGGQATKDADYTPQHDRLFSYLQLIAPTKDEKTALEDVLPPVTYEDLQSGGPIPPLGSAVADVLAGYRGRVTSLLTADMSTHPVQS